MGKCIFNGITMTEPKGKFEFLNMKEDLRTSG